ncbi:MAG: SOS response-associated peptidase [Desulfobacterales bacterium]|nr:SOS response-associated peptidase [Desulfobacterales bacterium]
MCGRFAQYSGLDSLKKSFQIEEITCVVAPSYNIAPLQPVLTVIRHDGNRLGQLHWGLVPSWAKDKSMAAKLINARAETVADKPSFRNAFKRHRCLILADGFYEWKVDGPQKQPWYFTLPSGDPFAFAGLWDTWKGEEEAAYHSCTIITTAADESVQPVHHRMPVILMPEAHAQWLDPQNRDSARLNAILSEGRVKELKSYPVSKRMNSARNNDPACIEPLKY